MRCTDEKTLILRCTDETTFFLRYTDETQNFVIFSQQKLSLSGGKLTATSDLKLVEILANKGSYCQKNAHTYKILVMMMIKNKGSCCQ